MTQQQLFKLKVDSLDLKSMEKREAEVEGVEGGKVLLVKVGATLHALAPRCTHYGAPLVKGVVTPDGRLTCPWHGACFLVGTGDVEDSPALDPLTSYPITYKDGAVYITSDEATIKSGRRSGSVKCTVQGQDKVVIVGGGSGTMGALEGLRKGGYKGHITVISREPYPPIDRTKLSKALIGDASKILLRTQDWLSAAAIDYHTDNVSGVDFAKQTVETSAGKTYAYNHLILATGGTPKRLPLPGFKELKNIFTLRTVPDVQAILGAIGDAKHQRIVVIGSSFIGMEVANCLASNEQDVTVVGMERAPLERVMGAEVGSVFQQLLEKNKVKFHMSADVARATAAATDPHRVAAVHLQDGTELAADVVILGVGVAPATDFLRDNAAVSLLKDGSLQTDESFRVRGLGPHVYAVGDIATYPYLGPGGDRAPTRIEHWNVAQNAGRAVGGLISGARTHPKPFIPIFWSALGQQLRYCGNTAAHGYDDVVVHGRLADAAFAAFYTKGDTVVAVATMQMDPVMTKAAELMRRAAMPSKKELRTAPDMKVMLLDLPLPAEVVEP
ncbi:MAG: hypothetical protein M1826_007110 [Phylliscum demangeonii]|nr:MAG: hypothetical protein M1826_007110 [Phylliscum demangeonii]